MNGRWKIVVSNKMIDAAIEELDRQIDDPVVSFAERRDIVRNMLMAAVEEVDLSALSGMDYAG